MKYPESAPFRVLGPGDATDARDGDLGGDDLPTVGGHLAHEFVDRLLPCTFVQSPACADVAIFCIPCD